MKNTKILYMLLIGAVIAADQISKLLVLRFVHDPVAVVPFFNLVLVWNKGISFGLFNGHAAPVVLALIQTAIAALFAFWLTRIQSKPLALAVCTVIGGAVGNVIDRLWHGAVVDFLDFHAFGYHYPAFNVADSCIVCGIAFTVFDGLFLEPKRSKSSSINGHQNA